MKKKNIFFVLLICFINSSCNKEEQTDELQDKDFYSDVTTRASYISGTITGEMNPYVSDGYYTYDLSIPIQKQSVGKFDCTFFRTYHQGRITTCFSP